MQVAIQHVYVVKNYIFYISAHCSVNKLLIREESSPKIINYALTALRVVI